jgi:hypothetical protein
MTVPDIDDFYFMSLQSIIVELGSEFFSIDPLTQVSSYSEARTDQNAKCVVSDDS